jgi:multidrug efflux pump subunit AcrB
MNLPYQARQQSRGILFVFLVLALLGGFQLMRLPVLLFPRVSFPRVRVSLRLGDPGKISASVHT